jgi:hypothetical protein
MKIGARKVLKDKPHNKPHIQGMLCYKPLVSFIVVLIIVHLCSFFFVIFVMLSRDFVSVLVGLFGAFTLPQQTPTNTSGHTPYLFVVVGC